MTPKFGLAPEWADTSQAIEDYVIHTRHVGLLQTTLDHELLAVDVVQRNERGPWTTNMEARAGALSIRLFGVSLTSSDATTMVHHLTEAIAVIEAAQSGKGRSNYR